MANIYENSSLKTGPNGAYQEGIPSGATYNATAPSLTDGQLTALQADQKGNLKSGISDPTTGVTAAVTAFHNSDNQSFGGTTYGLFTGGVAQIINPSGNLDRQRGTGFDGIPAVGIATGTQQLAGPIITTTFGAPVTGNVNAQNVTVASSTNIKVGDMVSTQDNLEYVEVLAIIDATHINGIFRNNHANGQTLSWYHYNQARDATIGDNVGGIGVSPSATFLYNNVSQNFEYDRSANGEKDGASGFGTAVAAEYEYNGGGPLNNANVISNLQFDRARNVQAKGLGSGTISNNPLAAGATSLTLSSTPSTLQPGAFILLDRNGTNPEGNYVGTGYTPGSTTVPLQNAVAFAHNQSSTVEWDQYATLGPGINGFTAAGVGIEEEALFNPVDNKFYLERSATQDAVSANNVVLETPGLINGAGTVDRQRNNIDTGALITASGATTTQTTADQVNYNGRGIIVVLNTTNIGTGSITLEVDGKDTASSTYYPILTGAAVTTNATNVYTIYPGNTVVANASASTILPRTWRIKVTANNANATTYTVGASIIL